MSVLYWRSRVFKSCIHHFEKVMLVYNCVGKFLDDKGSTLRWRINYPSLGGVVIDFSNLPYFPLILSVFVWSEDCSQRFYIRELFSYFVHIFVLYHKISTIFAFSSCLVVERAKAEVLVSTWTPFYSLFYPLPVNGFMNSFLPLSTGVLLLEERVKLVLCLLLWVVFLHVDGVLKDFGNSSWSTTQWEICDWQKKGTDSSRHSCEQFPGC